MSRRAPTGPSSRQLRVGEELRHAIAWMIERGELRDPDLAGVSITVTEVRVSPDLKRATAFVMPLGGGAADSIAAALNRAAPFVRRLVAREVNLRFAPEIAFRVDPSFAAADRIDALLREGRAPAALKADGRPASGGRTDGSDGHGS